MTAQKIHPATYSTELVPILAELLAKYRSTDGAVVLDPFGGLGWKFAEICRKAGDCLGIAVEIEPGYLPHAHGCVMQGDSTSLPAWWSGRFVAAITSPVYPNGMADNFTAKDDSTRHTYVHRLRARLGTDYQLQPNNAAGTNPRRSDSAMSKFYDINQKVYAEVYRCLRPGAPFIVNTKDTPNHPFTAGTRLQLQRVGFVEVERVQVPCRGLNHGRGHERKVGHEDVTVAVKP